MDSPGAGNLVHKQCLFVFPPSPVGAELGCECGGYGFSFCTYKKKVWHPAADLKLLSTEGPDKLGVELV
jgi:hypothetical protein